MSTSISWPGIGEVPVVAMANFGGENFGPPGFGSDDEEPIFLSPIQRRLRERVGTFGYGPGTMGMLSSLPFTSLGTGLRDFPSFGNVGGPVQRDDVGESASSSRQTRPGLADLHNRVSRLLGTPPSGQTPAASTEGSALQQRLREVSSGLGGGRRDLGRDSLSAESATDGDDGQPADDPDAATSMEPEEDTEDGEAGAIDEDSGSGEPYDEYYDDDDVLYGSYDSAEEEDPVTRSGGAVSRGEASGSRAGASGQQRRLHDATGGPSGSGTGPAPASGSDASSHDEADSAEVEPLLGTWQAGNRRGGAGRRPAKRRRSCPAGSETAATAAPAAGPQHTGGTGRGGSARRPGEAHRAASSAQQVPAAGRPDAPAVVRRGGSLAFAWAAARFALSAMLAPLRLLMLMAGLSSGIVRPPRPGPPQAQPEVAGGPSAAGAAAADPVSVYRDNEHEQGQHESRRVGVSGSASGPQRAPPLWRPPLRLLNAGRAAPVIVRPRGAEARRAITHDAEPGASSISSGEASLGAAAGVSAAGASAVAPTATGSTVAGAIVQPSPLADSERHGPGRVDLVMETGASSSAAAERGTSLSLGAPSGLPPLLDTSEDEEEAGAPGVSSDMAAAAELSSALAAAAAAASVGPSAAAASRAASTGRGVEEASVGAAPAQARYGGALPQSSAAAGSLSRLGGASGTSRVVPSCGPPLSDRTVEAPPATAGRGLSAWLDGASSSSDDGVDDMWLLREHQRIMLDSVSQAGAVSEQPAAAGPASSQARSGAQPGPAEGARPASVASELQRVRRAMELSAQRLQAQLQVLGRDFPSPPAVPGNVPQHRPPLPRRLTPQHASEVARQGLTGPLLRLGDLVSETPSPPMQPQAPTPIRVANPSSPWNDDDLRTGQVAGDQRRGPLDLGVPLPIPGAPSSPFSAMALGQAGRAADSGTGPGAQRRLAWPPAHADLGRTAEAVADADNESSSGPASESALENSNPSPQGLAQLLGLGPFHPSPSLAVWQGSRAASAGRAVRPAANATPTRRVFRHTGGGSVPSTGAAASVLGATLGSPLGRAGPAGAGADTGRAARLPVAVLARANLPHAFGSPRALRYSLPTPDGHSHVGVAQQHRREVESPSASTTHGSHGVGDVLSNWTPALVGPVGQVGSAATRDGASLPAAAVGAVGASADPTEVLATLHDFARAATRRHRLLLRRVASMEQLPSLPLLTAARQGDRLARAPRTPVQRQRAQHQALLVTPLHPGAGAFTGRGRAAPWLLPQPSQPLHVSDALVRPPGRPGFAPSAPIVGPAAEVLAMPPDRHSAAASGLLPNDQWNATDSEEEGGPSAAPAVPPSQPTDAVQQSGSDNDEGTRARAADDGRWARRRPGTDLGREQPTQRRRRQRARVAGNSSEDLSGAEGSAGMWRYYYSDGNTDHRSQPDQTHQAAGGSDESVDLGFAWLRDILDFERRVRPTLADEGDAGEAVWFERAWGWGGAHDRSGTREAAGNGLRGFRLFPPLRRVPMPAGMNYGDAIALVRHPSLGPRAVVERPMPQLSEEEEDDEEESVSSGTSTAPSDLPDLVSDPEPEGGPAARAARRRSWAEHQESMRRQRRERRRRQRREARRGAVAAAAAAAVPAAGDAGRGSPYGVTAASTAGSSTARSRAAVWPASGSAASGNTMAAAALAAELSLASSEAPSPAREDDGRASEEAESRAAVMSALGRLLEEHTASTAATGLASADALASAAVSMTSVPHDSAGVAPILPSQPIAAMLQYPSSRSAAAAAPHGADDGSHVGELSGNTSTEDDDDGRALEEIAAYLQQLADEESSADQRPAFDGVRAAADDAESGQPNADGTDDGAAANAAGVAEPVPFASEPRERRLSVPLFLDDRSPDPSVFAESAEGHSDDAPPGLCSDSDMDGGGDDDEDEDLEETWLRPDRWLCEAGGGLDSPAAAAEADAGSPGSVSAAGLAGVDGLQSSFRRMELLWHDSDGASSRGGARAGAVLPQSRSAARRHARRAGSGGVNAEGGNRYPASSAASHETVTDSLLPRLVGLDGEDASAGDEGYGSYSIDFEDYDDGEDVEGDDEGSGSEEMGEEEFSDEVRYLPRSSSSRGAASAGRCGGQHTTYASSRPGGGGQRRRVYSDRAGAEARLQAAGEGSSSGMDDLPRLLTSDEDSDDDLPPPLLASSDEDSDDVPPPLAATSDEESDVPMSLVATSVEDSDDVPPPLVATSDEDSGDSACSSPRLPRLRPHYRVPQRQGAARRRSAPRALQVAADSLSARSSPALSGPAAATAVPSAGPEAFPRSPDTGGDSSSGGGGFVLPRIRGASGGTPRAASGRRAGGARPGGLSQDSDPGLPDLVGSSDESDGEWWRGPPRGRTQRETHHGATWDVSTATAGRQPGLTTEAATGTAMGTTPMGGASGAPRLELGAAAEAVLEALMPALLGARGLGGMGSASGAAAGGSGASSSPGAASGGGGNRGGFALPSHATIIRIPADARLSGLPRGSVFSITLPAEPIGTRAAGSGGNTTETATGSVRVQLGGVASFPMSWRSYLPAEDASGGRHPNDRPGLPGTYDEADIPAWAERFAPRSSGRPTSSSTGDGQAPSVAGGNTTPGAAAGRTSDPLRQFLTEPAVPFLWDSFSLSSGDDIDIGVGHDRANTGTENAADRADHSDSDSIPPLVPVDPLEHGSSVDDDALLHDIVRPTVPTAGAGPSAAPTTAAATASPGSLFTAAPAAEAAAPSAAAAAAEAWSWAGAAADPDPDLAAADAAIAAADMDLTGALAALEGFTGRDLDAAEHCMTAAGFASPGPPAHPVQPAHATGANGPLFAAAEAAVAAAEAAMARASQTALAAGSLGAPRPHSHPDSSTGAVDPDPATLQAMAATSPTAAAAAAAREMLLAAYSASFNAAVAEVDPPHSYDTAWRFSESAGAAGADMGMDSLPIDAFPRIAHANVQTRRRALGQLSRLGNSAASVAPGRINADGVADDGVPSIFRPLLSVPTPGATVPQGGQDRIAAPPAPPLQQQQQQPTVRMWRERRSAGPVLQGADAAATAAAAAGAASAATDIVADGGAGRNQRGGSAPARVPLPPMPAGEGAAPSLPGGSRAVRFAGVSGSDSDADESAAGSGSGGAGGQPEGSASASVRRAGPTGPVPTRRNAVTYGRDALLEMLDALRNVEALANTTIDGSGASAGGAGGSRVGSRDAGGSGMAGRGDPGSSSGVSGGRVGASGGAAAAVTRRGGMVGVEAGWNGFAAQSSSSSHRTATAALLRDAAFVGQLIGGLPGVASEPPEPFVREMVTWLAGAGVARVPA